jgi:hypothetical protein
MGTQSPIQSIKDDPQAAANQSGWQCGYIYPEGSEEERQCAASTDADRPVPQVYRSSFIKGWNKGYQSWLVKRAIERPSLGVRWHDYDNTAQRSLTISPGSHEPMSWTVAPRSDAMPTRSRRIGPGTSPDPFVLTATRCDWHGTAAWLTAPKDLDQRRSLKSAISPACVQLFEQIFQERLILSTFTLIARLFPCASSGSPGRLLQQMLLLAQRHRARTGQTNCKTPPSAMNG